MNSVHQPILLCTGAWQGGVWLSCLRFPYFMDDTEGDDTVDSRRDE